MKSFLAITFLLLAFASAMDLTDDMPSGNFVNCTFKNANFNSLMSNNRYPYFYIPHIVTTTSDIPALEDIAIFTLTSAEQPTRYAMDEAE